MFGLGTLKRVVSEIGCDVTAARERDPAARGAGTLEILASYNMPNAPDPPGTASLMRCTMPASRWCR